MTSNWSGLVDAARRKIQIAAFHEDQLRRFLLENRMTEDGRPSIAVQASFEGVVIATIAAIDQVAQAINSSLRLGLAPADVCEVSFRTIERRITAFKPWYENPFGLDLRKVRTRMIHYSYKKSSSGTLVWEVEQGNKNYQGARELSAYAKAAIQYGNDLKVLLPDLEGHLKSI